MNIKNKCILIVDDDQEIADLLEIYLRSQNYRINKFYRGQGVWEFIENNHIDLAILDDNLPDIDGITLCTRIRQKHYFPIIMMTENFTEKDMVNGIMLGADDYIEKPFQTMELIARVKAQLRRAQTYNRALFSEHYDEIYRVRGLVVNADNHSVTLNGNAVDLTHTEFSILLYMCRHMGQVVKSEDIFEAVWQEKYLNSNNTVFVHIARIRNKMHENTRKPEYIKTVWGVGYKLEE